MKCHYEVLELARDVDSVEIKTAYRKLALKWHPDKNLENTEFAKEQFQLVQQAYEVLSDPQERAWYDKHREQILRGANSEFEDKCLDVFQYFTTTCFKGYGNDENGFYAVYGKVFEQIIKEDLEFIEDKDEFDNIPRFGNSESDYDEVVHEFYAYWSNYCTKKTYVWLDPYGIKEVRNRRLLKAVEKENKKVRVQAKKERNEEIRNLVSFVRKRDKRVQEHTKILEARILENRQKHKELSKQKKLERQKELEGQAQAEWAKFDNVKSELEQIEKTLAQEFGDDLSNSEDEEEINDSLYCVACNKVFKTEKSLANHESSKKHKENLERLKTVMLEEEEDEEMNGEDFSDQELPEALPKKQKKKKKSKNVLILEEAEEDCDFKFSNSDDDFTTDTKQKKKSKKNKSKPQEQKPPSQEKKTTDPEIDQTHSCATCNLDFPSKNKLFDHLKKTGHGVYLPKKTKNIK